MNYTGEMLNTAVKVNEPKETVKEILENTDAIYKELFYAVDSLQEAIYKGAEPKPNAEPVDGLRNEPMLAIIRRHRNEAEELLKKLADIQSALW